MPEPLKDLFLDDNGDLAIGANGDLLVSRDSDVVIQELSFRLKTTQGDWLLEPACGADLEFLVGEPNAPETGATMEGMVYRAATHDGFLRGEIVELRAVPINRDTLVCLLTLDYGTETLTHTVTLDLKAGVL